MAFKKGSIVWLQGSKRNGWGLEQVKYLRVHDKDYILVQVIQSSCVEIQVPLPHLHSTESGAYDATLSELHGQMALVQGCIDRLTRSLYKKRDGDKADKVKQATEHVAKAIKALTTIDHTYSATQFVTARTMCEDAFGILEEIGEGGEKFQFEYEEMGGR